MLTPSEKFEQEARRAYLEAKAVFEKAQAEEYKMLTNWLGARSDLNLATKALQSAATHLQRATENVSIERVSNNI